MVPKVGIAVLAFALLLSVMVSTRSEWVDYSSGIRCCTDIPVEQCQPADAVANKACRDVCHYGGCRKGGQCEHLGMGFGHGCHCNC